MMTWVGLKKVEMTLQQKTTVLAAVRIFSAGIVNIFIVWCVKYLKYFYLVCRNFVVSRKTIIVSAKNASVPSAQLPGELTTQGTWIRPVTGYNDHYI